MKFLRLLATLCATFSTIGIVASPAVAHAAGAHAQSSASASAPKGMPPVDGNEPAGVETSVDGAPVDYLYVYGHEYATATGATVTLEQSQPTVSPSDYHSLAELAAQSEDGQQIVEVGWTVDPGLNGDSLPHLFVYHWVNGVSSCYNGCGFVQVSKKVKAGERVAVGATATYKIAFAKGKWWIFYNGQKVGYFPGSLWSNDYTQLGLVQTFGEVSAASTTPCTQMGNGVFGSAPKSATISKFALIGSATPPVLTVDATNTSLYDAGKVGATGFRFGGPGHC